MGTGTGPTVETNGCLTTTDSQAAATARALQCNSDDINEVVDGIIPVDGASNEVEVYELQHVRRDFVDQPDTANVVLYVKNIVSNSLKVIFESQSFTVLFRSADEQFLALNGCKKPETVFRWCVPSLRGEVITSKCTYNLTDKKLDLRLKKVVSGPWSSVAALTPNPGPPQSPLNGQQRKTSFDSAAKSKEAPTTSNTNGSSSTNGHHPATSPKISLDDSYINTSSTSTPGVTKLTPPALTIDVSHLHDNNTKTNGTGSQPVMAAYRLRVGMRGLVNQSNNCYQNSVIQILANTPHLRDYCLNKFAETDINRLNPLGSKGRMVVEFVRLIRELWTSSNSESSSSYSRLAPIDTAQSVGQVAALRFRPFVQHDAQEFVTYLLDTIHEDLNQGYGTEANKNSNNQTSNDSSATITAESAWSTFIKRNMSPLVNMFYGQICNKITCQHCFKESNAYDPFMMLPLPIARPSKSVDLMCLYLPAPLSRDQPLRIHLTVPACVTSEEIKQAVRSHLNTSHVTCELKLYAHLYTTASSAGLAHFWRASDVHSLSRRAVRGPNSADVLIYETQPSSKNPTVTIHVVQMLSNSSMTLLECSYCRKKASAGDLPRCTRCQVVAYCGTECQRAHWKAHKASCVPFEQSVGMPLCFTVSLSISFEKFVKLVEAGVKRFVDVSCQEQHSLQKHASFEVAPDDPADHKSKTKQPAAAKEEVTAANFHSVLNNGSSKSIVKLRLVWLNGRSGPCRLQLNETPLNQFPVMKVVVPVSQDRVSLNDCFRLYFEPELMHSANAWMCPSCKKNRTAIQRSLISRYPRYLICYIKRFSQDGYVHKDREQVFYPSIIDVSPFVADEALPVVGDAVGRQRQNSSQLLSPISYSLYGVVNHYGTMQFGHYSSYARLPNVLDASASEVGWRVFDDEMVEDISPSRVVDYPDAYILFYQLLEDVPVPVKSKNNGHSNNNGTAQLHSVEVCSESAAIAAASSVLNPPTAVVKEDGEEVEEESSDDDLEECDTNSTTVTSPPGLNDLLLTDDTVD